MVTAAKKPKVITVTVNNQEVEFSDTPGRDYATGQEIKEAAITAGVRIQLDFALFEKLGRELIPVSDEERVEIRKRSKFRAVAPDDNSWES